MGFPSVYLTVFLVVAARVFIRHHVTLSHTSEIARTDHRHLTILLYTCGFHYKFLSCKINWKNIIKKLQKVNSWKHVLINIQFSPVWTLKRATHHMVIRIFQSIRIICVVYVFVVVFVTAISWNFVIRTKNSWNHVVSSSSKKWN